MAHARLLPQIGDHLIELPGLNRGADEGSYDLLQVAAFGRVDVGDRIIRGFEPRDDLIAQPGAGRPGRPPAVPVSEGLP